MRKNGKGKERNEEKFKKWKRKGKEENPEFKGKKDGKKAKDFFFFAFHFQETPESYKGSTKMEIST